jgi:hypothetical protein
MNSAVGHMSGGGGGSVLNITLRYVEYIDKNSRYSLF